MSHSLRPYFLLLQHHRETRSVGLLREELGAAALDALHRSGWLELVPPHELELAVGGSPRAVRDLAEDQSGTIVCGAVANERIALEAACDWLRLPPFVPLPAGIGPDPVVIGMLEQPSPRPVLFVRRVGVDTVVHLNELEKRGPALVLAATIDRATPGYILARYTGRSPVRLLLLEDFARVSGGIARFVGQPYDVRSRPIADSAVDECDLITMDGRRRISRDAVLELRATRGEFDLFVDFAAAAPGAAGYYGGYKRNGDTLCTFKLTTMEGAILREFISAPQVLMSIDELRCSRAFQMRSALKKFQQMRQEVDVCYGRNSYRAFRGSKNELGVTDRYAFHPPEGFRLAVLEPAQR